MPGPKPPGVSSHQLRVPQVTNQQKLQENDVMDESTFHGSSQGPIRTYQRRLLERDARSEGTRRGNPASPRFSDHQPV